jgi:hypothetical protein
MHLASTSAVESHEERTMNILLYRDEHAEQSEWTPRLTKKLSEIAAFETVQQRGQLMAQVRRTGHPIGLIVLQMSNRDELREFVEMKELFAGRRVVLILPDATSETLSLGHLLRPRYLMKPGAPMEWLEAIVAHMAWQMNSIEKEEDLNRPGDDALSDRSEQYTREN